MRGPDWFADWLAFHLLLHRDAMRLPTLASEAGDATYQAWFDALASHRVSREGADAASRRLVTEPTRYANEHFPRLLAFAIEATRLAQASTGQRVGHDLSTAEGARAASARCVRCGGTGLASVEHWDPPHCATVRQPATAAAYCVCAYGRWIKQNHREHAKDVALRMPDLDDAINRRGEWRVHGASELGGEVPTQTLKQMVPY